jgi:hypothetical protein
VWVGDIPADLVSVLGSKGVQKGPSSSGRSGASAGAKQSVKRHPSQKNTGKRMKKTTQSDEAVVPETLNGVSKKPKREIVMPKLKSSIVIEFQDGWREGTVEKVKLEKEPGLWTISFLERKSEAVIKGEAL